LECQPLEKRAVVEEVKRRVPSVGLEEIGRDLDCVKKHG
jgi:hypothetical protein